MFVGRETSGMIELAIFERSYGRGFCGSGCIGGLVVAMIAMGREQMPSNDDGDEGDDDGWIAFGGGR